MIVQPYRLPTVRLYGLSFSMLLLLVSELGFDRVASLVTLSDRDVVKDISISFAEKALLVKKCKEWCSLPSIDIACEADPLSGSIIQ